MAILTTLKDVNTMLYCLFLQNVIPIFEVANALLQKEEPCIHLLHGVLVNQFTDLVVKFIKPDCVLNCSDICKINFSDRKNQRDDGDIFVGFETSQYLKKNECDKVNFYEDVRNYYITACNYMLDAFPFGDEVLVNAEFLDISKKTSGCISQVRYFSERYKLLNNKEANELEKEYQYFQIEKFSDEIVMEGNIALQWHLISKLRHAATGQLKYEHLYKVARIVLVIYHSNTDCERLFSMVNKNKTEFRSSLSTKTLGNLMTRKMDISSGSVPCHSVKHSKELLQKCKKATSTHLKGSELF